ncbi:MAG TPA: MFS transporter [Alphaproteobacteria bacterium]|nr:MFS transporter [Alphaproteobacteria bacterium]
MAESKKTMEENSKPQPAGHPKTFSEAIAENRKSHQAGKPADTTPEYKKKSDSVNYSVKDGLFVAVKNGFTENFVMPFAIALNATNGMLAALGSVPQLVASFLQLFAQSSLKFFKTRSRLIVWTALIQAFMWIPLIFIPLIAGDNIVFAFTLLLIFYTLEVTIGNFQGPIYNSILGDIIDEDKRGEFFGKRNRVVNLMGFVSTFAAGLILSTFKKIDDGSTAHYIFIGFGILFFLAFISRLISSYYKSKIYDPPYNPPKDDITFLGFLKNMTHNNYGIFVIYIFLFRLVVNLTAPFFALYLLRDMQMPYLKFTAIIGIAVISSFLTMGIWGKMIDRFGSKKVLTISGFLIPFSPLLLILGVYIQDPTTRFIYLLAEEAFSGAVWAAFNLSTSSFLFDATSKNERVKYIAYYNFISGIAVFIGAMLGGVLIGLYPQWKAPVVASVIPFVFLTTAILRFLVTSIFIGKVREARMVEIDVPGRGFFHTIVSINPRSNHQVDILGVYNDSEHHHFHSVLPKKKPMHKDNFKPIFKNKDEEKKYYEKKSFDYYRENAMKTMNQKGRQVTSKDDSETIEQAIEKNKDNISKLTSDIQKQQIKKK